jgi:hypothetical protein
MFSQNSFPQKCQGNIRKFAMPFIKKMFRIAWHSRRSQNRPSWLENGSNEDDAPPGASIETPLQSPRGSAKERSTVVSTVKDTRAATSSRVKPRLASILPG